MPSLAFLSRKPHKAQIIEPPPSFDKRKEKEHQWLSSIASRASPSKGSRHRIVPASANAIQPIRAQGQSTKPEASPDMSKSPLLDVGRPPSPGLSIKSTLSRKFLSRKASNASIKSNKTSRPIRYQPSDDLSAQYDFVTAANSPPLPTSSFKVSKGAPPVPKSGASLASKLQELATAHGDGLLDEEEYRELRKALFEKSATASALPEQSIGLGIGNEENFGRGSAWQSSATLQVPETKEASPAEPQRKTSKGPASVLSSRRSLLTAPSITGSTKFFKIGRPTSTYSLKEDWESLHQTHAEKQLAATDHDSIRSGNTRRHASSTSTNSQIYGSPGVRSFLQPAASLSPPFSPGLSSASSRASFASNTSSAYPRSYQTRQSYISHSFETSHPEIGAHATALAAEIESDIQSLQAEFQGVDEQFRDLIDRAKQKHVRHASIEHSPNLHHFQTPPELASPIQIQSRFKRVFGSPKSRSTPLSTPPNSPPTRSIPLDQVEFDSPQDERAFKEEMSRINARRMQTAEKYAERLEYMQTRLKGAQLRESLP